MQRASSDRHPAWGVVARGVIALAVCVGVLTGCAQVPDERDPSGATAAEALELSTAEQVRLADERYEALNDDFAEVQREAYSGAWRDGAVSSELIPGQGFTIGDALAGDTRENSYTFTTTRWFEPDEDVSAVIARVEESWAARGWEVSAKESSVNGERRVAAITEDGFWYSASASEGSLQLTAHSPVYWGDRRAISRAVAERRDAEDAAGVDWNTADRDASGAASRIPGEYRPFPF